MKNAPLPVLLVTTILLSWTSSTNLYSIQYSNNFLQDTNIIKTENVAEQVRSSIDNSSSASPITFSTIWERSIASTHFTIYYNVTGPNGVSDEYARSINSSLEYSWTTEIDDYGFSAPPDSHITVYIMELVGVYGYTAGVHDPQLDEYHVKNITLDRNMGMNLLHYVCAHEFFHCIQLSYDNTASWFIQDSETWVIEGTAVWMGSMVYPAYIGDVSYVGYANQYMQDPDRTIRELDYDAVLFWIFLYENYGGFSTIKSIMGQNESLNAIQAANATLNILGTTFTEVFKEWTIANYLKNSYYSNGELFSSISVEARAYNGEKLSLSSDVADWGADYFEISSSVIYMPIQFEGLTSHNLTKALIEHGFPLISDFILNSSYIGFFPLMQANNLGKLMIIVRSLGNETSNNRVDYTLSILASSYTREGPYQLTSSTFTLITVETMSSQNSSTSTITTVDRSSTRTCAPKTLTVVNISSSRCSSEVPLNVTLPPPDIALTNVTPCRTVIGQGYIVSLNVTVENQGPYTEIFNVTISANTTIIDTLTNITLASSNSTTVAFTWNITGWAKGNYTISAYIAPVPGETDLSDNTFIDGWVFVTIQGDVDGDRDVDIYDVVKMCMCYGTEEGDPQYIANCDVDGDGDVDIYDIVIACSHYGETYPYYPILYLDLSVRNLHNRLSNLAGLQLHKPIL